MLSAIPSFVVIPAAGNSSRMGQAKLLLPYRGKAIIENVMDAWQGSLVRTIIVVVRPDDRRLIDQVVAFVDSVAQPRVQCVIPDRAPKDMKQSVQIALHAIESGEVLGFDLTSEKTPTAMQPQPNDAWLLAPADLPKLTSEAINQVVNSYDPSRPSIVRPTYRGTNAHPVLFPWHMASEVFQLGENEGVNALVRRHAVKTVELHDDAGVMDVDTPEDYRRLEP